MAPRLGLVAVPIPISKPADIDEDFATIVRERVQAPERGRIAAFAIERRLPTIVGTDVMARDWLLMCYGFRPQVELASCCLIC